MTIHCTCACKNSWLSLDAARIEVGPVQEDSDLDDPEPNYFRDIRVQTTDGEVLELTCTAGQKSALALRTIPKIQTEPVDWLPREASQED